MWGIIVITISTKDAKRIYNGIAKSDYTGWKEYAYNRAVIYPIGRETYIEHRKDTNYCSIRGPEYGYKGEPIKSVDYSDISRFLLITLESKRIWFEIM